MSNPDYSSWLTKQQAAEAIGVTTKTVERFVQAGQIQQTRWQPEGRGPLRAVYCPDDVARIALERQRGPLPAFLVPAARDQAANGNGHGSTALAIAPNSSVQGEDLLRALIGALVHSMSQTSQTSAYVDKTEALAIAGVSYGALREAVKAGEVKQRGRRYRRTDLEAL